MVQVKGKEERMKFTIYITDNTRKALRIRSIEEGVSATKIVEQLIEEYLRKPARRGGGR